MSIDYAARYAAALAILADDGVTIKVARAMDGKCPPWSDKRTLSAAKSYCRPNCGSVHGDRYRVTILRPIDEERNDVYTFDFWGSYADKEEGQTYGPADVIENILTDYTPDERSEDDVYEDFGPMKPSRCRAIVKHGERLRQMITEEAANRAMDAINDG